MADPVLLEPGQIILARRLDPYRKVQLRRTPDHLVINISLNAVRILPDITVIQHRRKEIPVPHLRAPHTRHPAENRSPKLPLLQIRGVQNRARRSEHNDQPVIDQRLGCQRHIKVVLEILEGIEGLRAGGLRSLGICARARGRGRGLRTHSLVLRHQQLIRERIVKMDPRKGHHILPVAPGQVVPVFSFDPVGALILRHRNVILAPDIWRIRKRPQVLRLRHLLQRLPDLACILFQNIHSLTDTAAHRRIDLSLILTEILHNIGVPNKRIPRPGHKAIFRDAKPLLLKAGLPVAQMPDNIP